MFILTYLGKAHLREALLIHEEAVAILKKSLEIKNKDVFLSILQRCLEKCIQNYEDVDQEDDFQVLHITFLLNITSLTQELFSPPCILPRSSVNHHPPSPVFSLHPTQDLFTTLGPIETFSAIRRLGKPRDIHLIKQEGGLGFCLRGEYPPRVGWVEEGSMAEVRILGL